MNNIVYLLGAGASAQALPLVTDFNKRMLLFYHTLLTAKDNGYREATGLEEDIKILIENEQNHYSIDTLAKKYWLAGSVAEYEKVKALMTCFLTFEVFKKEKINLPDTKKVSELEKLSQDSLDGSIRTIDKRYDALLAAILHKTPNLSLPSNVSFVSWNYDDQLEYAAWNIENAGKEFKFFQPSNIVKPIATQESNVLFDKNLVKLNGSFVPNIEILDSEEKHGFQTFFNSRTLTPENIKVLDILYLKLLEKPFAINIEFAWEHSINSDDRVKLAKEKIEAASDLVIIGYSFPNYNVEIDQAIIGNKRSQFKNIYIEDTTEIFTTLVERLRFLNLDIDALQKGGRIKHYPDLKTFCLPPSFFVEYHKSSTSIRKNSLI
jgi:hypothetical protein